MLGSIARKLRIFGFDTSYFAEGDDLELEKLAKSERRVILTSDKRLFALSSKKGVQAILVEGEDDRAKLRSIAKHVTPGVTLRLGGERASRCAVCNGELQPIERGKANASEIPPKIIARHRLFYVCRSCPRFYWRGKHWDRLRRLSYSLHTKDLT